MTAGALVIIYILSLILTLVENSLWRSAKRQGGNTYRYDMGWLLWDIFKTLVPPINLFVFLLLIMFGALSDVVLYEERNR